MIATLATECSYFVCTSFLKDTIEKDENEHDTFPLTINGTDTPIAMLRFFWSELFVVPVKFVVPVFGVVGGVVNERVVVGAVNERVVGGVVNKRPVIAYMYHQ